MEEQNFLQGSSPLKWGWGKANLGFLALLIFTKNGIYFMSPSLVKMRCKTHVLDYPISDCHIHISLKI